jgi:hypothetical protein
MSNSIAGQIISVITSGASSVVDIPKKVLETVAPDMELEMKRMFDGQARLDALRVEDVLVPAKQENMFWRFYRANRLEIENGHHKSKFYCMGLTKNAGSGAHGAKDSNSVSKGDKPVAVADTESKPLPSGDGFKSRKSRARGRVDAPEKGNKQST